MPERAAGLPALPYGSPRLDTMRILPRWNVILIACVVVAGSVACFRSNSYPSSAATEANASHGLQSVTGTCRLSPPRKPCEAFSWQKSNYGPDNRMDIYCFRNSNIGAAASSVLLRSASVATTMSKQILSTPVAGEYKPRPYFALLKNDTIHGPMCKEELFSSQPRSAHCAVVLVGEDGVPGGRRTVLSAKHCLVERPDVCTKRADLDHVVFDYEAPKNGALVVKATSVCTPAVDPKLECVGEYLVLMDIECPAGFTGRPAPIAMATPGGGKVYAIGYPMGLPAKFSGVGDFIKGSAGVFHAELDVQIGNSGSPVFSERHEIVGIIEAVLGDPTCSAGLCRRWNHIDENSRQQVKIIPTNDIPAVLARRAAENGAP